MKLTKSTSLITLLSMIAGILIFLFPISTQAIDGHLKITSPNGGQVFTVGQTTTITWDASPNIDKIMLGYSTGPGSLNWIATSIPNTGSYAWKINVGNTTNTQFKISITGYETGAGSLSDTSDGYFTVNQIVEPEPIVKPEPKPEPITTTPDPEPTPVETTETPTVTNDQNSKKTAVSPQETLIISITEIEINQWFYFEGSKTTDLSSVDPRNVKDFTLDRMDMLFFTFIGNVDLSGEKAIQTFEKLDENVYMDTYYFWFTWEFWILFETDVEVTFYDDAKTLPSEAPVTLNGNKLKKDEYTVKTATTGEKTVKVKPEVINKYVEEGEKIEIGVQPSLNVNIKDDEEISTSDNKFELEGSVSDSKSLVFLSLNGEKIELSLDKEGKFKRSLELVDGENVVKVTAQDDKDSDPFATIEGKIIFDNRSDSASSSNLLVIILIIVTVTLIGGGLAWYFFKNKRGEGN